MTADEQDPENGPAAPSQGPPLFVNPDAITAQQYAPPTFVKAGGVPIQPAPQPQPYGAPQPDAPVAPGYTVVGGTPGGPVFVAKPHEPIVVDEDRPWGWWVGPLAVFVAFAAVIFLGIFIAAGVALSGGGDAQDVLTDNEHWLGVGQDILWIAVVLLVPFIAVRHLTPEQLGLRRQPFWRSVGVLAGCMVVFYVVAGAYSAALGLDENSNQLLEDTGFGDSVGRDIVFALLFTVAAPVAEELLFRGLLFKSLRDAFVARMGRRGGVALGAVLSGVIFGGIHVGGGQDKFLPVLMALGILLALAYEWSGTLYVPVIIHSINNAVATGFNSDPAADWIYGLIAIGPLLAIATFWLLSRFVRSVFPQERPEPPLPPAAPPAQFMPSGGPANL